jgi:hypothetical protein
MSNETFDYDAREATFDDIHMTFDGVGVRHKKRRRGPVFDPLSHDGLIQRSRDHYIDGGIPRSR